MLRLPQLDPPGRLLGQDPGTEIDAHEGGALGRHLVEDLVRSNLGLVVRGEAAVVDLAIVLVPLTGRPPRGAGAAGSGVGDEQEARDGGDGGGCADEIDGGVAVYLVGLVASSSTMLVDTQESGGLAQSGRRDGQVRRKQ